MRKTGLNACCALLSIIAAGAFLFSIAPSEAAVADRLNSPPSQRHRPIIADSRFEVDVLVNGRSLEEFHARDKSYVEAIAGAEYEVRIRNPLPYRVAVALSVDGLNSIDARRTSAWNASKWVIEPYGTIQIGGWQMSSDRARRFYFTTERDSYAAKLGQTSNLGLISAVFFREIRPIPIPLAPPPRPHPRYEKDGARDRKRAENPTASGEAQGAAKQRSDSVTPMPDDEYAATGIGRSVRNDVRWVNMDLDSRPAAEVTLRYEYYPTLVRLGILPRQYDRTDSLRRREGATGFEDRRFSPEP
ncbi:MAG: hypothetical protein H0V18_19225 [Pyrinomonadaceae bacterium]|nr:hypothetical protein [Pyrinomonadaceae bacterium]